MIFSLTDFCFKLDCVQSLSSPNFSEVGELASEARAASREKRFYPYVAQFIHFHSRVGSEENRTAARSLVLKLL